MRGLGFRVDDDEEDDDEEEEGATTMRTGTELSDYDVDASITLDL